MSKERERERDEPKKKGVPLADIGADVIWDDPKLRVPFSSNPFISRMKGSAFLSQTISYGLYYNELTNKWTPITSATMTESLIKARYYAVNPDALEQLSDNPLRSDANQNLMVVNKDVPLKVSDLTFLDTTKLSVKDAELLAELVKLTYLDTTKLSVKDADSLAELVKLTYLDTTKLSVKDADLLAKLELVRIINDSIKTQTDKLQFDGSNNLKCVYAL